MSALSNYLENKLIEHTLRNTAYTSPATVYLALYTTNPTDADSGTEASGGSYARQAVTFAAASNGSVANSGVITFPQATADWGTITHFGVLDALTTGNLLFFGALSSSTAVNNGSTFTVEASALTCSLA